MCRGYEGSATTTLMINQLSGQIDISNKEHVYDGTPKEVSIITNPEELNTIVLNDGIEEPPTEVGIYDIRVNIDEVNYIGSTITTMFINAVTGLSDDLKEELVVYPNPVSDILSIQSNEKSVIKLINNKGQIVFERVGTKEILINGYPKGVYLIRIDDNTQKVVIK